MTPDDIRRSLLQIIGAVAPEADAGSIDPARPLRAQIDLDSVDWLQVLIGIHDTLGVDIPDAEAAQLRTLQQLVDRCAAALGTGGGTPQRR